jgi:hypothetical protein
MKIKKYSLTALSFITAIAISSAATAGVIDSWNVNNVITDPGPYSVATTYYSTILTPVDVTNGAVAFKYGDVQPPGLKVVNGDPGDVANCIMTTGYNPGFPPFEVDKSCNDPLQFSKRFKLTSKANGPLDVDYHVVDGVKTSYKILQKWTDATDKRWNALTVELGFTVNGEFVPSTSGDGLGFSDTRGKYFTTTTSYQAKADVLSTLFAQGLAGPADKYHPETGYFDIEERMSYGVIATEDIMTSDGISANYLAIFGEWVNSSAAPIAIFYDDDGDIGTDNLLIANCADSADLVHVGPHSGDDVVGFTCDGAGQWVTFKETPGLDGNGAPYPSAGVPQAIALSDLTSGTVHTSIEHASASSDANPMYMDYIEDAANLGMTFWVTVDDNSGWPTPDGFTVRYTPVAVDAPVDPVPEVCTGGIDEDLDGLIDCDDILDCVTDPACDVPPPEDELCDGMDGDGDGLVDCADPDCEGVDVAGGTCGPEGKFDTCSDGFDNDGDLEIDCEDSGCAKNKSCR